MTIAEIIAAKKAKQTTGTERKTIDGIDYARNAMNPEWVAQGPAADLELEEAINRIDPPGKRRAGLIISSKNPLPKAEIEQKAAYKEERSLSQTKGEAIPMVPINADEMTTTWHSALNAFESELCLMRDPTDSDVAWLAIKSYRAGMPPILIHRLPWTLWDQPHKPTDQEPF